MEISSENSSGVESISSDGETNEKLSNSSQYSSDSGEDGVTQSGGERDFIRCLILLSAGVRCVILLGRAYHMDRTLLVRYLLWG